MAQVLHDIKQHTMKETVMKNNDVRKIILLGAFILLGSVPIRSLEMPDRISTNLLDLFLQLKNHSIWSK